MMEAKKQIEEFSRGFMHSAILLTAHHLGVFEALGNEWRTPFDLGDKLALDVRALETVLLALASEGVLESGPEGFRLAPAFAPILLRSGAQSMASILDHHYHLMKNWVRLDEVMRSGQPVPREAPDEARLRAFICGMADLSRASSRVVADKFDLSPYRRLLDLGGGPGTAAITFAQRHPNLECVVFDLPPVVEIAKGEIAAAGLEERVKTRPGDFMTDDLGEGYDIIYIANIIHMMGVGETAMLVEKCRRALTAGDTIVIREFFLEDDRITPPHAAMFSVNMLVGTEHGKSYTLSETREILQRAGFGDFSVIDIDGNSKLLVGKLKA